MLSPVGIARRVGEVPSWWVTRFLVAHAFFQEEQPFVAFWPTRIIRPTEAVCAAMVTEMTCVSAKNLLRSAYQYGRLYRI